MFLSVGEALGSTVAKKADEASYPLIRAIITAAEKDDSPPKPASPAPTAEAATGAQDAVDPHSDK